MKVNLNDSIKVRLTDYGKELLLKYNNDNNFMYKVKNIKEIKRTHRFHLWQFMQIFGNGIHMGFNHNIIEKNIFEILEE